MSEVIIHCYCYAWWYRLCNLCGVYIDN